MITTSTERLAYRVKDFAQLTGLSLSFVKREIYAGKLKTHKKGSVVLILVEDARAYLEGDEAAQKSDPSLAATV